MNRIPRTFDHILAEALTHSNAGRAGDLFYVVKTDNGYIGTNTRTEKEYSVFPNSLRNDHYFKFVEVVA